MKCLCAATRHAARTLTRHYEESLRPADLTTSQFELLGTLFARPGIGQSELAEILCVDQTTLSRNFSVAISRKWVARTVSTNDRRQAAYKITAKGREAWQRALPYWNTAQKQMQRKLGSDWAQVWAALDLLNKASA